MKASLILLLLLLCCPLSFAKKWNYDVPCQKVFVTGTQQHEIRWALKGQGLNNNLYKETCLQPVADAAEADAILDIEFDPVAVAEQAGRKHQIAAYYNRQTSLDSYWVSCWSDRNGSYCHDSAGYALSTSCSDRGCSSYYGPDASTLITDFIVNLGDMLLDKLDNASAWGYLFSAKDHRLLWKYEGKAGTWHYDLTSYSRCPKKFGSPACKKPKALLEQ